LLIQRKDSDRCTSLQGNGLVLGQFPNATYSSIEKPLAAGDRFLLYTDGIIEPINAFGEEFGEESLRKLLTRHSELSAGGFADALLEAIGDWTARRVRGASPAANGWRPAQVLLSAGGVTWAGFWHNTGTIMDFGNDGCYHSLTRPVSMCTKSGEG
jgi:hypothetical protein